MDSNSRSPLQSVLGPTGAGIGVKPALPEIGHDVEVSPLLTTPASSPPLQASQIVKRDKSKSWFGFRRETNSHAHGTYNRWLPHFSASFGRQLLPWATFVIIWTVVGHGLNVQSNIETSAGSTTTTTITTTKTTAPEKSNTTIGKFVDSFDHLEGTILGLKEASHQRFHCQPDSLFAKIVHGKKIVIVLHRLTITGAPLALLEFGTKVRSCGGTVSAVILDKQGGLYSELVRREILPLPDKFSKSFIAASNADLVVVASAVCASWVEQYLRFNPKGADRLVWWMMENRRDYFDKSKKSLGRVRALIFLSDIQLKVWRDWARRAGLNLAPDTVVVPLSINDELASVAGLNDVGDSNTPEEKRRKLREEVRREMGLDSNDVLVMMLSTVTPDKGQMLLLEAALMVVEGKENEGLEGLARLRNSSEYADDSEYRGLDGGPRLKVLIGSIGSKGNSNPYVQKVSKLLNQHPRLAEITLSIAPTTHVAPLYAAADAYVMNAQGIGETFGRVTIEAMAFGLPVLATEKGGSKEIVEANVTGLLHPIDRVGIPVLAQHIRWLVDHKDERERMGQEGRAKVNRMYREDLMYENMARTLVHIVGSAPRPPKNEI